MGVNQMFTDGPGLVGNVVNEAFVLAASFCRITEPMVQFCEVSPDHDGLRIGGHMSREVRQGTSIVATIHAGGCEGEMIRGGFGCLTANGGN